jgi:hypothetical protein
MYDAIIKATQIGKTGIKEVCMPDLNRQQQEQLALFQWQGACDEILCEPLEFKEETNKDDKLVLKFRHAVEGMYIKGEKLTPLQVFMEGKK